MPEDSLRYHPAADSPSLSHAPPAPPASTPYAAHTPSFPVDAAALRARLQDVFSAAQYVRGTTASTISVDDTQNTHEAGLLPPYGDMPLAVAPPCLIQCPKRFAFAHLATPTHNPTPLIRPAIQTLAGNPAFIMGGSWRGVACLTFSSPEARESVLCRGPLASEGNTVTLEPVELVDRSIVVFSELVEVEVSEFPHELWHDEGIRFILRYLGDVIAIDHFCLDGID